MELDHSAMRVDYPAGKQEYNLVTEGTRSGGVQGDGCSAAIRCCENREPQKKRQEKDNRFIDCGSRFTQGGRNEPPPHRE